MEGFAGLVLWIIFLVGGYFIDIHLWPEFKKVSQNLKRIADALEKKDKK